MVDKALPGDIEDPGRIFPAKPVTPQDEGKAMPSGDFAALMKKPAAAPAPKVASTTSPFALMQGTSPVATTPTADSLLQQVHKMQNTTDTVRSHLNTPNLKLKASTKYLLKNKLSESNDHLQAVNAKLGASETTETAGKAPMGPLAKFIGYLTYGQNMMNSAKMQLEKIKASGTHMSPGDFLLVQLKMNKAQQLLEYSSVLLSNAVSDIKQFMQIQL